MLEVKTFKEIFGKLELSSLVADEFGTVKVERIQVNTENRILKLFFKHNEIIKEHLLTLLKMELCRCFPLISDVEIQMLYELPEDTKSLLNGCWENILFTVRSASPVCYCMLNQIKWKYENGVLSIPIKHSADLALKYRGIDKIIRNMLSEGMDNDIKVLFEHDETIENNYDINLSNREKELVESLLNNTTYTPVASAKPNKIKADGLKQSRSKMKIGNLEGKITQKLAEKIEAGEEIIVCGKIFELEQRETKSGRYLTSFDITDNTNSITVKFFSKPEDYGDELKALLKTGNMVIVKGKVQFDDFSKELNVMAYEVSKGRPDNKMDNAPRKRVELHLHTQMSSMDAITPATEYINRASKWGHKAIAITDHGVVQAFPEAMEAAKKAGIKVLYGIEAYLINDLGEVKDFKKLKYYHAVIFAKNYTGLRNLYELVSISHINYFHKRPRIPKSEYVRLREGLIIGTACEAGELYKAVFENRPIEEIRGLAEFYDYFEIQPTGNNMYLVRNGKAESEEELRAINKKIVMLGKEYNKPVVATCDVHFINPEDEVYRRIIMAGEGFNDADIQAPLYFRTTQEMLEEFSYLGRELAEEIVITNTNLVADMIDEIKPIPDETFPPKIEGAEQELAEITMEKAKELYGEVLPPIVADRLERELNSIIKNGFSVMYIIAQKLVWKSLEDGYLVGSRGSVGSSLVATMAGITEVNPLPPHYLCAECKHSDFDSEVVKPYAGASGCDMPDRQCPNCGALLKKDGHDIPFETFLGFDGDKEPDIDLNFSGEYQAKAHAYTEYLFGEGHVFKAGTIGTLADKTAYGYVRKYLEEREIYSRNAEINRLKQGCTGIKKTTGQHPGGLMIVPNGHSIYEFCPVQRPANDSNSNVVTTHFDYHSISGRLLKLDILGHDVPTIIRMLHDITGIDPRTVDLGDKDTLSLFTSPKALGVTPEEIRCKTGTLGLPEFGTSFVRQMLLDTQPNSFAELVRISGLSHGTDVWFNNAQDLIRDRVATLKEVIPTRDDIMVYLINKGVEKKAAFKIMENVRKGKGLKDDEVDTMKAANVDDWYIESCRRIKYMFPKGHAVAYVMMTIRIAYFKIHYPYSFYAASFSVKSDDFDYELMCLGKEKVVQEMDRINAMGKEASSKDKNTLTILELVLEMYARGLKFAPLSLYEADAVKFKVTNEGLMPPLSSVQGLGGSVAQNIVEARAEGEFMTIEDFRARTKTNKTVIELLKSNKILEGIPENNQLSLF